MIKAICFDLDGTLVERKTSFNFAGNLLEGFEQLGIDKKHHSIILEKLSHQLRNENIPTASSALLAILKDLNLTAPETFETVIQERNQAYFNASQLMTGAQDMLNDLNNKNIPLALITNGPADMQKGVITHLKLEPYFKVVLVSGDLGVRKPSKRIFDMALDSLGSSASETLMVGDNPTADLQGALNANLQAVQIGSRDPKPKGIKCFKTLPNLHSHILSLLT